jgi:hypothetical protein
MNRDHDRESLNHTLPLESQMKYNYIIVIDRSPCEVMMEDGISPKLFRFETNTKMTGSMMIDFMRVEYKHEFDVHRDNIMFTELSNIPTLTMKGTP